MSIATNAGKIIVKDGAVAENCDCCGGGEWYCCASRNCFTDNITSIEVSITAEDWHFQSGRNAFGFRGSALTSPFTLPRLSVTSSGINFGTPPIYGISQLLDPAPGLVELSLIVRINDCSDSFGWSLAVSWKLYKWEGNPEDFTRERLWESGLFQFPNYNQSVVTGISNRGLAPISSSGSTQIDLSGFYNFFLEEAGSTLLGQFTGNPIATFSVSIT